MKRILTEGILDEGQLILYEANDIGKVIHENVPHAEMSSKGKKSSRLEYYNVPSCFDIETSSWREGEAKRASMYLWMITIGGSTLCGRTWEDFKSVTNSMSLILGLGSKRRFVIYVHNLSYEFQWIRNLFEWSDVFSLKERHPIRATTKTGIEFRCSYALSGYSLKKLPTKKYKKLDEIFDYSLVRHSQTELSNTDYIYCAVDTLKVVEYIQEQLDLYGSLDKIPMTKTGRVRNFCRDACMKATEDDKWKYIRYRKVMRGIQIQSFEEYCQLKRGFAGGFTHACAWQADKTLYNVGSFDIASSYPAVMVGCLFPMGNGELYTPKSVQDFRYQLEHYCCIFDIRYTNLIAKTMVEHPLSSSRCKGAKKMATDNGRVIQAEEIITTLTEQDFFTMEEFYTYDKYEVVNLRRYFKNNLPREFILSILSMYGDKTALKGVEGKQTEYNLAKENINSAYGMTVTDILRDTFTYTDDWGIEKVDPDTAIPKYNDSGTRFLAYQWGVWVTAHARRRLFKAIKYAGEDYVYSDTDSVKVLNPDKFMKFVESENREFSSRLDSMCRWMKIDPELTKPCTPTGKQKPLGAWEYEGTYSRFKTLGAKRYMVEMGGKVDITVSGVNKVKAVPFLVEKYGDEVFDAFTNDLYIPAHYTGKNCHTYIDEETHGTVTDYNGITAEYRESSSIHMEESEYSLSMPHAYITYIKGVQTLYE